MAKRAVEHQFRGLTTPYTAYDHTKTNLGKNFVQQDGYAGPVPMAYARPMEQSTAIPGIYPHVIEISEGIFWVFLADNATATTNRRIILYVYNRTNQTFSWRGFITMNYPPTGNQTIRGMRVVRHLYTTGTISASGTAVTGSGTAWQTARYAVGGRIGFGSTDPTQITTWYHITAIGSNTSITLQENAGTVAGGTPFVIEELRVYTSTTNATTASNGGLFVCKGVNYDDFISAGTTFNAATTTDNLKAHYWLADAATSLNIAAGGLGMDPNYTDTSHDIYVINADSGTSLRIYKYNGRAALSGLSSGKSTSAYLFRTAAQTVTGTISQTNSSRIATLNHGPGSGVKSLYLATTTRVYRCNLADILDGTAYMTADCMVEIPTGSANTFAATSGFTSVDYMDSIDRLVITCGSGQKHYVTRYQTVAAQFDRVLFMDDKQLDQSTADSSIYPHPNVASAGFSIWTEDGIAFLARVGTTALVNVLYAVPLSADWDFAAGTSSANQARLISPALDTSDARKLYRLYTEHVDMLGSSALGICPEPFRMYARTNGITDDSGAWVLIDETGDLSGLDPSDKIQFMYEFRMMGPYCIPNRIYSVCCVYEDYSTDSHYQPSVVHSSTTAKRFAWRFSTTFGGTVPTLYVRIYDAISGTLLLTDSTSSPAYGAWQKTTNDGSSWGAYDTSDKTNETTYIRYTPTTLADNVKVRAIITQ